MPKFLIYYLLTYSMVQSPSWEANWFAASQQIPRISRNPKVHYRTHKLPPAVSILGQPNPVHISTSHLLEIHPNIIHPSTPRSPQWSPSLRFPHQDPTHPPFLTHTHHMPSPSHSSRFYHSNNIGWRVQIYYKLEWRSLWMEREERRLRKQNIYMRLILELKMMAVVMIIAVLMSIICRAYKFFI